MNITINQHELVLIQYGLTKLADKAAERYALDNNNLVYAEEVKDLKALVLRISTASHIDIAKGA